jgi:hypothetical protein
LTQPSPKRYGGQAAKKREEKSHAKAQRRKGSEK